MEKIINVAELLKNCPIGMELDCLLFETPVQYVGLAKSGTYQITIKTSSGELFYITKNGYLYDRADSKCIIFPKGKTTWEGFQRPFKDGDIIYVDINTLKWVSIFKKYSENEIVTYADCELNSHTIYGIDRNKYSDVLCDNHAIEEIRLATEEEKQKLFDAIKENGYAWNAETKTLEKLNGPRFKVGDVVKTIYKQYRYVITGITDTHYTLEEVEDKFKYMEPIIEDKNWELVNNKFKIDTLIPFESKVLVRDYDNDEWKPTFWGFLREGLAPYPYETARGHYKQCIPYDDNKHLMGKTHSCDEYYKTWEKL